MGVAITENIRKIPRTSCYICSSAGNLIYRCMKDVRYGCPGLWDVRRCSKHQCGLLWLDPVPIDEDIHLLYQYFRETHEDPVVREKRLMAVTRGTCTPAYRAFKYGYPTTDDSRWWQRNLKAMLVYLRPIHRPDADFPFEQLSQMPKGRLLDVGCGGGGTMKLMKEWGWHVEGVDFDSAAIENARKKGLTAHLGALSDQAFADNSFDAVIMSHVVEHVPRPIDFLREVYRILRPGGRLVIATPNAWSLGHRLWRNAWISLATPYHLFVFNPSSLSAVMVRAGFAVVSLRTTTRWAQQSFMASLCIYRFGCVIRGDIPQSLPFRLFGSCMAGFEWLSLCFRKNLGEEIVATGTK
jgi:2-polyprenyl-3-methyl-5-hydroxy-6-metoxy-1,4-benzoquinol methylase